MVRMNKSIEKIGFGIVNSSQMSDLAKIDPFSSLNLQEVNVPMVGKQ